MLLRASLALQITALTLATSAHGQARQPVDYVDPNIGGIGILLTATLPTVQYPHGMMRVAPVTTPGISDRYLADKIYGFPAGPVLLMPSTEAVAPKIGQDPARYASHYDHDLETASPYYYSALLEDSAVSAEVTVTQNALIYRFTFPKDKAQRLVLSMGAHSELRLVNGSAIAGSEAIGGWAKLGEEAGGGREFFYAELSSLSTVSSTWHGNQVEHSDHEKGDDLGLIVEPARSAGDPIEVKVGISYISEEQARLNLEQQIPSWSFDDVKAQARAVWEKALGQILVTGGTERERTIFYTALYRSLGRMTDITEGGKYYSGYDHKIHDADGHDFYTGDGLWDTYRSMHPLQLLLDSGRQEDMVRSYLRMFEQSGWLPSFPEVTGEQAVMIGHHAIALITDTYQKGYRNFDVQEAYTAMKKSALEATMLPWVRGPKTSLDQVYFDKGFFPALAEGEKESEPRVHWYERRQAVSVTLENSYDDWCVAQMAKALGKTEDYAYFMKLAHNYQNLYEPELGLMAPKSADGKWVGGFDPMLGGGDGARAYFTEVNTWNWTFNVQHDPAGEMAMMGGRDQFNAKLDQLFLQQPGESKFKFYAQFPDATGLVGMYAQGNEPSFNIPYLYDFSGEPWKTQQRVRQMMALWFGDGPMGIPGDDDGGATSSWYVLSAMGFYPVCPGEPVYEIGSPIFAETRLTMGNGKVFVIEAAGVSARNKYIQSAELNGKPLDRPWFAQSDLTGGGRLTLIMGPFPNKQWGSAVDATPPSMSSKQNEAGVAVSK